MRSTQEWEKALEGTTPAPWKVLDDHPGEVGTADNRYWIAETYQEEIQYSEGDLKRAQADARLIALAPEAVAEVVRLRKAIEDRIRLLRLPLCSHVPDGDELDDLAEQWGRQSYEAEVLTSILEGTHE